MVAEPGAAPEPETELPADLLEAFQEGLARLAHKDPEAAPSGLAAADEAGPPGPGPAPEDEQHAAGSTAVPCPGFLKNQAVSTHKHTHSAHSSQFVFRKYHAPVILSNLVKSISSMCLADVGMNIG